MARPKFLLSENLNKLAKWLRALGYDALVLRKVSLANMRRIANRDRRIILSRSRQVARSPLHFRRRLIVAEDSWQQLEEILDLLDYDINKVFTRCIQCNRVLCQIEKQKIENLVPQFVYQTQIDFFYCRNCGKVYWQGTHYQDMKQKLQYIFKNGGKE